MYQEHVYHDNLEDAAWFHEHMEDCAVADCKALCEWFGIPYVEETRPAEPVRMGNILLYGVDGDKGTWERVK